MAHSTVFCSNLLLAVLTLCTLQGVATYNVSGIYVQFSQSLYIANEADGYVTFTVTLNGSEDRNFSISVNLGVYVSSKFQPKAANSDDVKDGIYRIVFNPGVNSRTIRTGIINDDKLVEGTEAFGLLLIVPKHQKPNGLKLGKISVTTVHIIDDDKLSTSQLITPSTTLSATPLPTTKPTDKQMSVTVQFEFARYTVQESCTMLSVTLVVMGEVIEPFTVDVIAIDFYLPYASAEAGKDFEAEILQVTFLPGQSHSNVCVIIIDDDIREENETFHLLLIPYSVQTQKVLTGYSYHVDVKIIDDADDGMGLPVQIPPTDDERAAMCGCKPLLTSPILSPSLSLIPSSFPSPIPSFTPSPVSFLTPFPSPLPTLPPFLNFTVMFNDTLFGEDEVDGIILITVVATGTSSVPYTVTITPSELVPVSARELFNFCNDAIVLTFNPGDTEQSALIFINPDCIREGSEFFNLTLSLDPAAVALGITLGDPSVAAVKINNTHSKLFTMSKSIYVQFSQNLYVANEADGYATFTVTLNGNEHRKFPISVYLGVYVSIEFQPQAANSDDVKDGVYRIVFKPGVNSRTIRTGIINDDKLVEGTEAFGLLLIVPKHHKPNGLKLGNISIATVLINDDDKPANSTPIIPSAAPTTTPSTTLSIKPLPTTKPTDKQMSVTVQFESVRYTVQESCTMLSVTLVVMGEVSESFTVYIIPISYYLPYTSAKANEDFETEILQVTFLPGQSHSNACVIVIDDDIREGNENFYLLLSVPYNVSAQPYYADVQIIDDDDDGMGLPVQFPPTNDERTSLCRCKSRLTSPSPIPSPIPSPFPSLSLIPSPIPSFLPLSTPSLIPSAIPSPTILSPIQSPSPSLSPPSTLPLNFTVMFNDTIFSGAETNGIIKVTVIATGISSVPYNVTITPSELLPVSARELFNCSSETTVVVTFNHGDTEQSVLIVVNPDCAREGSEFINLTLSLDPAAEDLGITLGDPSVAAAEIKHTDMIYVNLSQATYSAKEADEMMMITVEADGFSIWSYTVEINPMEILPVGGRGNAEGNGTDFVSNTLTAVFNPGDSKVVVSMPVIMDQVFEPAEALQFSLTVPDEFSNINGRLLIIPGSNDMALGEIIDSNVIVNFSTDSYRAVVNATSVVVRVTAFGSTDIEFLVQVIPDAVDIPEGGDTYFDPDIQEVFFPLSNDVVTTLVPIPLFPEAVGNRDLNFTATLVVPPAAMSQGVILGEPSVATVTVPAKG